MSSSFPSLSHAPRAFPLPSIPEDTLDYTLHLPPHLDPTTTAALITSLVHSSLPRPWLWNRDSWELKLSPPQSHSSTSRHHAQRLEGRMRVGDAVDDEWLVVWLLREVSKKWKDVVISIRDSDGEFLLIEGANELPSWVSPESAENRLWLMDGHLHLVPLSIRSASGARNIPDDEKEERQFDPEAWISEDDGAAAARSGSYRVEAKLEEMIWARIASYPDSARTHLHRAKAWLPEPIARALKTDPELVQRAVEGFYVRDPAQLRAASRMTHFPPSSSILTTVLMTRPAYAQLQGQVFHPPRIFGPEWSVREDAELNDERRWRDLGVKIATGFEIMYREGGKRGRSGSVGETVDGQEYRRYIDGLKAAGFFGDEVEGSQKWKEREVEARNGWIQARSTDTTTQRPSFAYQVDQAIKTSSPIPLDTLRLSATEAEDSDSWLEVSPDELDGMLMRSSGQAPRKQEQPKAELGDESGEALRDLAQKVQDFVGGEGDAQGARFEDELSDDDDSMDSDHEAEAKSEPDLSAEEKKKRMQDLVPSLPVEDWGRRSAEPEKLVKADDPKQAKVSSNREEEPIKPINMRPPVFAKQEYDGYISDSDSEDESALPPPGTLGRRIAQMKWSEGDPDLGAKIEEVEDEDDRPQFGLEEDIDDQMEKAVWGEEMEDVEIEMEPDMDEEQEEFLKFAREALGVNEQMWEGILSDRRGRGVFVPPPVAAKAANDDGIDARAKTRGPKAPTRATASAAESKPAMSPPQDGEPNMDLDSFETVMAAMDAELAKSKIPKATPLPRPSKIDKSQPIPKLPTEKDLDDMDEDDLLAMDRELRAALKGAGVDDDELDGELDPEEAQMLEGDDKVEYKMMRDFLESYRSQGGGSGVVGNLFGRLGEKEK